MTTPPSHRACTLLIAAVAVLPVAAAAGQSLVLQTTLHFDNGTVTVEDIGVVNGTLPDYPDTEGSYIARLVDDQNQTLYQRQFNFQREIHGHFNADETPDMRQDVYRTLTLPYGQVVDKLLIYHEKQLELVIDVPHPEPVEGPDTSTTNTWLFLLGLAGGIILLAGLYLSVVPEDKKPSVDADWF